jgi:hypothetical protein
MRNHGSDESEAVNGIGMNAHILIFECPNCGRPMPFVRLDEEDRYPTLKQEVERVDLGCFGDDCGWRGTFATGAARQRKTIEWPHLKSAGCYENQMSPTAK